MLSKFWLENGQKLKSWPDFNPQQDKYNTTACNTHFFYKQRFFSTQPQCCLTFSWIELQVLLRCCLMHISIMIVRDLFIFTLFVPMSILRSIFVVSMWSVFHFYLHFHDNYSYNLMSTDIHVLLLIFRICAIIRGW